MVKAIIFDLDGTLLDTAEDLLAALDATFAQFSLPSITKAQLVQYIGNGARALIERCLNGDKQLVDKVLPVYVKECALAADKRSGLYAGEREALICLKRAGLKLAVLSNKPHAAAVRAVNKFLPFVKFDCVQGGEDGLELKPSPMGARKILNCLGVSASECVLVGDGETDVQTAKNLGAHCVSVTWGYRSVQTLKNAGAEVFARSFGELAEIVKNFAPKA